MTNQIEDNGLGWKLAQLRMEEGYTPTNTRQLPGFLQTTYGGLKEAETRASIC
jgi:hypothetical protein